MCISNKIFYQISLAGFLALVHDPLHDIGCIIMHRSLSRTLEAVMGFLLICWSMFVSSWGASSASCCSSARRLNLTRPLLMKAGSRSVTGSLRLLPINNDSGPALGSLRTSSLNFFSPSTVGWIGNGRS